MTKHMSFLVLEYLDFKGQASHLRKSVVSTKCINLVDYSEIENYMLLYNSLPYLKGLCPNLVGKKKDHCSIIAGLWNPVRYSSKKSYLGCH